MASSCLISYYTIYESSFFEWETNLETVLHHLCRVTLVVAYLGWVDIDLDVPPSCKATQPICPQKQPDWNGKNEGHTLPPVTLYINTYIFQFEDVEEG